MTELILQSRPMDAQPLQEGLLGDQATEGPLARSTNLVNPSVIRVLHVAIKKQFQHHNVHHFFFFFFRKKEAELLSEHSLPYGLQLQHDCHSQCPRRSTRSLNL